MSPQLRNMRSGLGTVGELIRALWKGPYWWLIPVVIVLLPTAIVFILLQAVPMVAPFVYTIL